MLTPVVKFFSLFTELDFWALFPRPIVEHTPFSFESFWAGGWISPPPPAFPLWRSVLLIGQVEVILELSSGGFPPYCHADGIPATFSRLGPAHTGFRDLLRTVG